MSLDPTMLFRHFGGAFEDEFPTLHSQVLYSEQETPYLLAPGVVTLARPQVGLRGLERFLAGYENTHFMEYASDPTALSSGSQACKTAGQLCYMSFGPKRTKNAQAEQYFTNLKESGHGSVLEHATYSFLLYGVSRSLTHELVRHRAGIAFSQQSQRFVSGRLLRFVERPEYQQDMVLHRLFLQRIDRIKEEYRIVTEHIATLQEAALPILQAEQRTDLRKKVQQVSRSLLPNETEAPLVMTGNARAWRHILATRGSAHAEIEIRALAVRLFLCLFHLDAPLFSDFTLETLPDGTIALHTPYPKV